jgi:hypothetical protein
VTDYTPGDPPVPVGSIVDYEDRGGRYRIVDHYAPEDHPYRHRLPDDLTPHYPDGVAYYLWPEGVAVKFGNRDQSVGWVRRTSFRVIETPQSGEEHQQ